MTNYMNFLPPIGRIMIANIFLIDGINKISYYEGVAEWMFLKGVPEFLLPLVILLEIFGALAIILGWRVKLFSLLFFVFCILTAIIFHRDFSNNMDKISFMKNMSLAGGFLFLFLHGAGKFSLDSLRNKGKLLKKQKSDS